jgi:hypothetical protein
MIHMHMHDEEINEILIAPTPMINTIPTHEHVYPSVRKTSWFLRHPIDHSTSSPDVKSSKMVVNLDFADLVWVSTALELNLLTILALFLFFSCRFSVKPPEYHSVSSTLKDQNQVSEA